MLTASIVGVLSAGSLIYLWPVRSNLTDVFWGAGTAVGVVVLAMIPFAVSGRVGPYWYVGHAHLKRAGRARITVIPQGLPAIGGVLGAFGLTRAPAPTGLRALGRITATRPPLEDRLIRLRQACGRYVDWYRK